MWLVWSTAWAGTLTPTVHCANDPEVAYSMYLPEGWHAGVEWPLLVVIDPAAEPEGAARFYASADALGVVVVSPSRPLDGDLRATWSVMVDDVIHRALIDDDTLMVAGTGLAARAAWALGEADRTRVAGVIGVGASTPSGIAPRTAPPFAWYGLVAEGDFNHVEAVGTIRAITQAGGVAALETIRGVGAWPASESLHRALGFLVVHAELAQRIPSRPGRATQLAGAVSGWAELTGGVLDPWYVVRGWPGLEPLAQTWSMRGPRRRIRRRHEHAWAREMEYRTRVRWVESWFLDATRNPPSVAQAKRALGLAALERRALRTGTVPGMAATRMLAYARVRLGEITSRAMEGRGYADRAATVRSVVSTAQEEP